MPDNPPPTDLVPPSRAKDMVRPSSSNPSWKRYIAELSGRAVSWSRKSVAAHRDSADTASPTAPGGQIARRRSEISTADDLGGYPPNRLARQNTDRTAEQRIDERIILEARRLLTTHRIQWPSSPNTGFDDPSNFSKYSIGARGRTSPPAPDRANSGHTKT
ncbi:hypothetical protein [Nocardia nepalensis]|uniref:hypothetical protein n=1 Tax=Nocardia nepalensis TaxID=3375448 RepID=UPI003B66F4C5